MVVRALSPASALISAFGIDTYGNNSFKHKNRSGRLQAGSSASRANLAAGMPLLRVAVENSFLRHAPESHRGKSQRR
jgi:hypothetical protein